MDDIAAPPAYLSNRTYVRLERYLKKNADEIEHYLSLGFSISHAVDQLHTPKQRPSCIVCGEVISRARRSAIFCRKYEVCRKYARRYVYLYQTKRLTKTEALAKVFEELS
jgi:hypothetical protein